MFNDPLLHKLEILYQASSAPKRWLREGRYAKFHAAIRAGLKITGKKKMDEAVHLILFALNYSQFPDGALITAEEPDFILTSRNSTIGIEHSRLFVQHPGKDTMKGQESIKERVVEGAFKLYRDSNRPPLMISCSFNNDTNYRARDINVLSQKLVAGLSASLAKQTEWTPFEDHDAGLNWLPGMMLIQGRAPAVYEPSEGRWEVSHGGSVYPSESFIQTALNSKGKKLDLYRKQHPNCDEFWMLLVVEELTAASFMHKPDVEHVFTSSFNRVFVYELIKQTVTEVQCRQ